MRNLIQITQDGACILSINDPNIHGFFTEGIQSCVIYIIRTKLNWIAFHDSGQLSIKSLTCLIKDYGKVLDVTVIYGNLKHSNYFKRNKKLLENIKYNGKVSIIDVKENSFDLYIDFVKLNIKYATAISANKNIFFIPNVDKVNSIIKLNNAFIELGTESLDVDIQYKNNSFMEDTKLLHSLEYIFERMEKESEFYKINRLVLEEALNSGAIKLDDAQQDTYQKIITKFERK